MNKSTIRIPIFFLLVFIGGLGIAGAQTFDIASGGQPTITGAPTGSVTGSSSTLDDLVVTVNFGELSPMNASSVVKVVVPIAIRSTQPYRVTAQVSGLVNANPQSLQPSDIGFGVNNFRPLGNQAANCINSSHIFYSPFHNDPASNITINAAGRAAYPSALSNIVLSTTLLTGPRLSNNSSPNRQENKGYAFDAILAVTPQFFAAGSSSGTITFTISAGPNVPC